MTQSILHSQHESLGAQFQSIEEWEIPVHYGDPVAEYLAVRQHVGIADLSHRGKILVTGDDRIAWLQSIISNDLLPLESGQGLYSSIMNHKGKMLSYFRVYRLEEALLVEDVGEIGNATFQTFRKFLLYGTKAKMNDSRETLGQLLVSGPKAGHLIQQALGFEIEHLPVLHFSKQNVNGHQAILARTEETGETDLTVFIPRDGFVPIWEKLWEVGKTLKLHPFGTVARKSLRIEAGHPHVGPDLNEDIVPPEANLEGKAFSLSKGCYPGQEVVARMDTYGTVKRRLVGLVLEVPSDHLPLEKAKLFSGTREVGWVSSAVHSPILQKTIALGFSLRDFTKPDTALTVESNGTHYPGVVQTLPFSFSP
ncbi:MAG: aminomethyl transferase family protein [Nitrospirales bacterium]|nr:aminomethyl transferase family protein [Nitrospirales bacterium]